jgi:hypothetical protein
MEEGDYVFPRPEEADWAENERRWRDPHTEHWWTLMN